MVRYVVIIAVAVVLAGVVVPSARAAGGSCPDPGPGFGEHIASMAPEHPLRGGGMFGHCVSAMASGG